MGHNSPGIKRKIITMCMTIFFLLCNVLTGQLWVWGYIAKYPYWARGMFAITAIYILGGCMLQTFGHIKLARILGVAAFLLLCVCAFYSECVYEYVIFALCIATVLHRMSHVCECVTPPKKGDSDTAYTCSRDQ